MQAHLILLLNLYAVKVSVKENEVSADRAQNTIVVYSVLRN